MSSSKSYIYALVCPLSKKVRYIGVSNRYPNLRKNELKYKWKNSGNQWIAYLNKFQKEPILIILEEIDENPFDAEKKWISFFRECNVPLINICEGGKGPIGIKQSDESNRKRSEKLKGRIFSDETREKIRQAKIGKPRKDLSERNKMSRRLDKEAIHEIRDINNSFLYLIDKFKISKAFISMIRKRKRYKDIV